MVAFGAIALLIAVKKTTGTGIPEVIRVGLLKIGPKPLADPTAQPNIAIPKIGMMITLTRKRYRNFGILPLAKEVFGKTYGIHSMGSWMR